MAASASRLTVLPQERVSELPRGTTLRDALSLVHLEVVAPCGGEGTCGKCRVEARGALSPPTPAERGLLTSEQLASGIRLACQARLEGEVQVRVPASSRPSQMRIVLAGRARRIHADPGVTKHRITLLTQTLAEAYARLEHLRRCGDLRADLRADLGLLRRLPGILSAAGDTVTAVVGHGALLDVEPGDTADHCYGVALDLGTTTVVASLVDLRSGRELARAAAVNQQTHFGYDVVSRIRATLEQQDGLAQLQQAAQRSISRVVDEAVEKAGADRRQIYEATLVGNATMMHLFLGIDPASLGHLPYVATVGDAVVAPARDLRLDLHPAARLYVLPNIAGFVGADTVGAILAAGLDEDDGRVRLLADIGTNCEIALRLGPRLLVTSTPAGPAFEGACIACGMLAAPGAIEKVHLDGDVHWRTIGGRPPRGLCGSGLVDAAAELLHVGIIDSTGRLLPPAELDGDLSPELRRRLVEREDGMAFVLAHRAGEPPIVLTQRDVRELQLAKAAIRTGIDLLLERAGLTADDLDEFCIAGGFGSYIDKTNAVRLGLIPNLPPGKLEFVGNSALAGARLALLSCALRRRGDEVARQSEHLQLAHTPDFQMRFSEAMMFE
ncbi:MAG: ASKHA domain-containing protein [Candidatus Latescibacterota bacterium]